METNANGHKNINDPKNGKSILVKGKDGYLKVYTGEIVYCKADGSYSDIVMENGVKIPATVSLKALEKKINEPTMLRCHHSYLVNGKKVEKIVRCERKLITSIEIIRVSRRKWHETVYALKTINNGF